MPAPYDTIKEFAKDFRGNWKKFEDFLWHDEPEDSDNWGIYYTESRDSGLLAESNAAIIDQIMEPFTKGDDPDAVNEHHRHWAAGYLEGYSVRVKKGRGYTKAFKALWGIVERLQDYAILDEEDFSKREYEATLENIQEEGKGLAAEDAPENWYVEVYGWLANNNERAIEPVDEGGGYPTRENITEALMALGMLDLEVAKDEGLIAERELDEAIAQTELRSMYETPGQMQLFNPIGRR